MKKIKMLLCLAIAFMGSQTLFAQSDSTKAITLKAKLVDSICVCFTKTDIKTINNINDVQGMMTRCMTSQSDLLISYAEAVEGEISTIPQEKMKLLGAGVAAAVYEVCPAMKAMIDKVRGKQ